MPADQHWQSLFCLCGVPFFYKLYVKPLFSQHCIGCVLTGRVATGQVSSNVSLTPYLFMSQKPESARARILDLSVMELPSPFMFWLFSLQVHQGSHASLKVLESTWIFPPKFKALKVLENRTGAWKSLKFIPQVLESPWIHQVSKQVFCLKQELLIIVMFCFYQLKLSHNHRNRY